jgi:gamma-resorcylate decarboxylase
VEGNIVLEEHCSTALNNRHGDAKGEEGRHGRDATRDIARRLLDPDRCLREMDLAGIAFCVLSRTSPGVQAVLDTQQASAMARDTHDDAALSQRSPDRLSAFVTVALQDPQGAADPLQLKHGWTPSSARAAAGCGASPS